MWTWIEQTRQTRRLALAASWGCSSRLGSGDNLLAGCGVVLVTVVVWMVDGVV